MRQIRPFRTFLFLFLLVPIACTNTLTTSPETPKGAEDFGYNLLVDSGGSVELKRDGWQEFHPSSFGAVLYPTDQLNPAPSGRAVVLCQDLSLWIVPTGVPSSLNTGCPPPSEPALKRNGSYITPSRGAIDESIPYIISPRMTSLLKSQPILRWNEISGDDETEYRVVIRKAELGEIIWETKAKESGIPFSDNTLLQPDVDYLLVVEANNDKSSEDEGTAELGFQLMDEYDISLLESKIEKINSLDLTDTAKSLALAHLYSGNNLKAAAIETLEELVKDGVEEVAVYQLLGELNLQLGVFLIAQGWYEKSMHRSESQHDAEGLAASQAGLGAVYAALGAKDQNDPIIWLTKAKEGYLALGDVQRAEELTKQLEELDN